MQIKCVLLLSIALMPSLAAQVQWTEFPARMSSAMSEESVGSSSRLVVFGGQSPEGTTLGDTQVLLPSATNPSWQPLSATSTPPPTSEHAMAHLPSVGVVMFGGKTDPSTATAATWIFHGDSWSQVQGALFPAPRTGHAMALDESRNRIVLYGGKDANSVPLTDTWEFDGTSWIQVFPPSSPGTMVDHSMAFQPATNSIILVERGSGLLPFPLVPPLPAWRYDGAATTWTSIPGPNSASFGPTDGWRVVRHPGSNTVCVVGGLADMPVAVQKLVGSAWTGSTFLSHHRFAPEVTYDPVSDRVYMYGGFTSGMWPAHTTLVWDGTSATMLQDDADPDGRSQHALVSNTQDGRLYLLGGNNFYVPFYGWTPFEMWRRVDGQWERLPAVSSPSVLHGAAFDSARSRIVVLAANGTWEWNGVGWTQVATTGPSGGLMAFDAHRGRTVVFGGAATWEWDGATWSQLQPIPSPSTGSALAYDPVTESILLFGGGTPFRETWRWDGTNWTLQASASPPPAGAWPMATDPFRRRVVMACGPQTWEWDGAAWIQRTTTTTGPLNGAMALDPQINKLVVFSNSGSTWEYGTVNPAVSVSFGQGCPGGGAPPTINADQLAWVGDTARFVVTSAGNPTIGLLGFNNLAWGGIPLPAELTLAGMPGCYLYESLDWIEFLPQSTWSIFIPDLPGSVGRQFYVQGLVFDSGAPNPFLGTTSNCAVNVIGEK